MSNTSVTESASANSNEEGQPFLRWLKSPHLTAYAALAIALTAVAVAITAWFQAHEAASPSFSAQQSADAKQNVCSVYALVYQAVNTDTPNPRPDDPVSQNAVAANVRLAFLGGGAYLNETLAAQPATPADLAEAINSMASTLQRLGLSYLARAGADVTSPLRKDLGSVTGQINSMCA